NRSCPLTDHLAELGKWHLQLVGFSFVFCVIFFVSLLFYHSARQRYSLMVSASICSHAVGVLFGKPGLAPSGTKASAAAAFHLSSLDFRSTATIRFYSIVRVMCSIRVQFCCFI